MLFAVVPTGANGLQSSRDVSLLLGLPELVVPVSVPKRKDFIIPHLLYNLIVNRAPIFLLNPLPPKVSPLDQNCSKVVYPLASLLCRSRFEI